MVNQLDCVSGIRPGFAGRICARCELRFGYSPAGQSGQGHIRARELTSAIPWPVDELWDFVKRSWRCLDCGWSREASSLASKEKVRSMEDASSAFT
jgi:hypothetical protein